MYICHLNINPCSIPGVSPTRCYDTCVLSASASPHSQPLCKNSPLQVRTLLCEVKGQQSNVTFSTMRFEKHKRAKDHPLQTSKVSALAQQHNGNQPLHLSALVTSEKQKKKGSRAALSAKWRADNKLLILKRTDILLLKQS